MRIVLNWPGIAVLERVLETSKQKHFVCNCLMGTVATRFRYLCTLYASKSHVESAKFIVHVFPCCAKTLLTIVNLF